MPRKDAVARTAKAMAQDALARHFGRSADRLVARGGGLTNFVFEADHAEGPLVVRVGREPGKVNAYIKEQWAMAHAAAAGVPVPEVLEVGNAPNGLPYMIMRQVAGVPASEHPHRLPIVREMGRLLAAIHSVGTNGFGGTFDWSANRLSRNASWTEFLEREVRVGNRLAMLRRMRVLPSGAMRRLEAAIRALKRCRARPVLSHGDMRLKNVIVDRSGAVKAVLDWENSISAAGPAWDLSIALHDLAIDAKHELLAGYGMQPRAYESLAPLVKALNIVNYAPSLEEIAARDGRGALASYRLRLRGALDLYSL